ncbi:branched-chain amino acid ABC transporter substrate-binding protein [Rhodopseudomonas boonkerdii]|uniref:ABC transporter substrate-binding protein n=1 Tax=Rhodopseudomonas boonkerdii TaxID=475937 RepID=UPI001E3F7F32|nr:ABC transporter substrate-binding protein [Rhodopseudomonas boonkerdii]UGV28865.1 branched-chain amino acid ABC transporter substrate-binding protein [Rhodopseudomonas boonkerdii]
MGSVTASWAQSPGVTDKEITLGTILPFSGPASSYATSGMAGIAYFDKVNAEGGINGRTIKVISYDDGYSPPKTVEQARKLVESDEVLMLFSTFGTPTNVAIMKYMNIKKVPQLFVGTGGTIFGDHKKNPWTMGFRTSYQTEGQIYAKYLLKTKSDAKIAVLYQNDDFGKDHLTGLRVGLGEAGKKMIVAETGYEVSMPTVDSQVMNLKASGADVLVLFSSNKFSAQALRKSAEIGWKPLTFIAGASSSVAAVMKNAGFENVQGVISGAFQKDPDDPQWARDEGVARWRAFMEKYYPKGDQHDLNVVSGYNSAQVIEQILKGLGKDVTRARVMEAASSLKDVKLDMLLPGITVNTAITDHYPVEQLQLVKFEGERWKLFGDIIDGGKIEIAD